MLSADQCYQAVAGRDPRFDGMFFTAVATTRIFCRPSCPARTPMRRNVDFYPTAAAAVEAGYRACKRCRPDVSPGSPDWDVRADVGARAMRLIRDGLVDRAGVSGLASALGYSSRQLGRVLHAELGAGPLALARSERVRTARTLVESTTLTMSDIAFASGFASIRQFNDTFRATYGVAPGRLRTTARPERTDALVVRLAYRPPIDFDHLFGYLGARAVPGIEHVGPRHYTRSLRLAHGPAVITVEPGEKPFASCRLRLADSRDLGAAIARARRILDLDADPVAVRATLTEAGLRDLVDAVPGIRSPGHSDPVELAIRTVLGQQISVKAARTHLTRLVESAGDPLPDDLVVGGVDRLFPTAERIAALPTAAWALPGKRIGTLRTLATAFAEGKLDLGPGSDRDNGARTLLALPGIGPWSVGYIRMRALGDPDVFLGTDLGVATAIQALTGGDVTSFSARAEAARPWRSYLTHLLWAAHHRHDRADATSAPTTTVPAVP